MLETFMVLIVVVIILSIGIYFFYSSVIGGTKQTAKDICNMKVTDMLTVLTSMPEIQCSFQGATKVGCIDVVKMQAAIKTGILSKRLAKGCKKTITLEQFYPEPSGTESCTETHVMRNDFDNCVNWTLYKPKKLANPYGQIRAMPVSLYYPTLLEHRIGMVKLIVHS